MGCKEDVEVTDKYFRDDVNAESTRIQTEELDLLQQSMDQLSLEKREILILSKYQEMRYKEIADLLKLTESAVKVRIFRALKELKTIYEKLEKQSSIY